MTLDSSKAKTSPSSIAGRTISRSATGTGGRSHAQASRRDRRGRRSGGAGRQSRDRDDADRIRYRSRPGQSWSGRKHQSAGRQYHGRRLFRALEAKLLGMLHELVPKASIIAVLRDPNGPDVESRSRELEEAARAIGRQILMVNAANEREFHAAFAKVVQAGAGGLLIPGSVFFFSQRRLLVALAARHALPTVYYLREYAEVGGLISYGPSQSDAYRRAGVYVGRISRAKSPATCRSNSGLNSIWSSTSPPQRHSASKFRPACSRSPTR